MITGQPWRVQLVSVGRGTEMSRSVIVEATESAGFTCDVWDSADFVMNPELHTSAASVRAVYEHDVIIALADLNPGSRFAASSVPPEMASELTGLGVLPLTRVGARLPTLFQVEVLTAKALGKPTLVFLSEELKDAVVKTLSWLSEGDPTLMPRTSARTVNPV